ncbi:MAG: hypothetical protein LCI00_24520 [Chloroflexi bacterium]|nr:hypothetical protein [Chloroflexota bacterium]MCC6895851.1 hypothetical protein [Anaerolineae bacterium]
MNDFLKSLDPILKPINDAMRNIPSSQIVRYVMIYALIVGIINLCGSIGLVSVGLFGGAASIISGGFMGGSAEGQQATAALGAASGIAVFAGILYFIEAPILLVVAYGLYRRAPWARMGTVFALLASAFISLLHVLGGDIFSIIWVLVGLYLAYFFYTDAGVKREFGQV